jgi:MoaA/NifB/PqqE/SkfB family radical SAM enzyme
MKNKNTFCAIPFTHISSMNNGFWRHCCVGEYHIPKETGGHYTMKDDSIVSVWNSEYMKQLRLDLINGVQNKNCDHCWKRENVGAFSHRQKSNNGVTVDDQTVQEVIDNNGHLDALPDSISVKIGNLCNLKCIMCSPLASSQHEKEVGEWKAVNIQLPKLMQDMEDYDSSNKEMKNFKGISSDDVNINDVIKNIEPMLENCKLLQLVGGEPLVNPITSEILELCVNKGYSENITIQLITNLSTIYKKHFQHLSKFKDANITISFDHIENEKFNYIRFPADYETFRNNFDTIIKDNSINGKISTTFSIFNILDIEKIFDEFEKIRSGLDNKLVININLVTQPNYFDIKYLEDNQKESILNSLDSYLENNKDYVIFKENAPTYHYLKTLRGFCSTRPDDFNEVVIERTRVLELYDRTRGTNYRKLFPFIKTYDR